MLWVAICAPFVIAAVIWMLPRPLGPDDPIPPQVDAEAVFTRAAPCEVVFALRVTNEGRAPLHVLGYTVVQGAVRGKHRYTVPGRPAVLEGADAAGRVHAEIRIAPRAAGETKRPSATLSGRLTVTAELVNMLGFTVFVPHLLRGQERDAVEVWVGIGDGGGSTVAEGWLAAKLDGR